MSDQNDFQKEWPKIKKQLISFSKDALILVKKGEEEIVRFSKKGKLHLDTTALQLKKEHIYHLIGKEYISAKLPKEPNAKMKKLITEYNKIDKDIESIKKKIREKKGKIKTKTKSAAPRKKRVAKKKQVKKSE